MSTLLSTLLGAALGAALGFITSLSLWRRDQRRQWFLQVSTAAAVGRELFGFLNSEALWMMTRQGRTPESELDRMLTIHSRAVEALRVSRALAPTDELEGGLRRATDTLAWRARIHVRRIGADREQRGGHAGGRAESRSSPRGARRRRACPDRDRASHPRRGSAAELGTPTKRS